MPRVPRKTSATGIYHVMARGIDKRDIFLKVKDCRKFLSLVKQAKEKSEFQVFAYCLMPNHLHLLLKTDAEPIGDIMKRITAGYANYHNKVHERCGHLFQNRFRSEAVEDDLYFKTVLRYIHQNPVKAKISKTPREYQWSSYLDYLNPSTPGLTDTEAGLSIFRKKDQFISFMNAHSADECLDMEEEGSLATDKALTRMVLENNWKENWKTMTQEERGAVVASTMDQTGAGKRQMARALGISRGVIDRLTK